MTRFQNIWTIIEKSTRHNVSLHKSNVLMRHSVTGIATWMAGSVNSPPRIRRLPHRKSADFLIANSSTSPPRIPYREFADLSLSLANFDRWIRGESMANVRTIICVIGEYHSSRIRRNKFVWIRGEYSPRKFQMNSTVGPDMEVHQAHLKEVTGVI